MQFDDLDSRMRVYETANDRCVPPQTYIVARLDGRGFTRLTKETCAFKAPFDEAFRDLMVQTTEHVMTCGFNILYGYTESDEISLLFHLDETSFGRKTRKLVSVLAGEASAVFSLRLGRAAAFDCRVSELPNVDLVVDYFRWRNEDAHRNSLNAHCYWMLRTQGESPRSATAFLAGMTVAEKNEFLFANGINYNDLPSWEKRGVGLFWEEYAKVGQNPQTEEPVVVTRRRVAVDLELPTGEAYATFVRRFLHEEE
ncbi:MAG: hypothetical protein FWH11_02075 [Micrococcales bacterium]|nr:hypothetical protein [Micrococcales bacterium]